MDKHFNIETRSYDWRRYLAACVRSNVAAGAGVEPATKAAFETAEYLWDRGFFDRSRYEEELINKGASFR